MVAQKRKSALKRAPAVATQSFALEDVIAAVKSLFADELKPVSKVLRKRIFDRLKAAEKIVDVDMNRLQSMCSACPLLSILSEDKGDWSAVFVGQENAFVDVNDPHDPYPASMWTNFAAFCGSAESHSLCLSGGRCAAAEALRDRRLPFFANLSLGRMCHIVELALNAKKLLGYKNSCIVPYQLSERAQKEQSALQHQPTANSEEQVATLETARECLKQILQEAPSSGLPLPNVKRLFRSRFDLQLSETTFGHTKVSDLLQDSRFQDICTVDFNGGFIVKRKAKVISILDGLTAETSRDVVADEEPCRVLFCEAEPLNLDEAEVLMEDAPVWLAPSPATTMPQTVASPAPRWCLSPNTLSKDSYAGIVRNTFIHADLPPCTPLPGARRRLKTEPAFAMNTSLLGALLCQEEVGSVPKDTSFDKIADDSSTTDNAGSSRESSPDVSISIGDWPLQSLDDLMTFTPFDESRNTSPRVRFSVDEPLALVGSNDQEKCPRYDQKPKRHVHFTDETTETTGTLGATDHALLTWPALTPGTLSKEGFVVRGTFLDVPPALPTPFSQNASRRSRSVPKSMGSKGCFEELSGESGECELSVSRHVAPVACSHVYLSACPSPCVFPPTPWQY